MRNIILFILLFISISCSAQIALDDQVFIQKGLESINRKDAVTYIGILASDSLEGREAGKKGGRMAAEYLKSTFEEIGIKPWRGNYFQSFSSLERGRGANISGMRNVIGYIEGKNTDELVIIGAHYDHEGIKGHAADSIYNGADDNASGVSAVLQVARAFVVSGKKPDRTILFTLWDGEEKGLLGSFYFVKDHSTYMPVPKIVAPAIKGYINCDMIGRNKEGTGGSHVSVFISENKAIFSDWIKSDIENYKLALEPEFPSPDSQPGGSDHMPFDNNGVPYIFYNTDLHPDYHQPSDHADKINYDKVVDISKAAFLNLWNMANIKEY